MAEIMRKPVKIQIDDRELQAFGDDHTHGDIVRWLMVNPFDGESVHDMLGEALAAHKSTNEA